MVDIPPVDPSWTDAEQWAWKKIADGIPADFNARYDKPCDPASAADWEDGSSDRRLSPEFLHALFDEPRASVLPATGVRIKGALVSGDVEVLSSLPGPLEFEGSRIEDSFHLFSNRIEGSLTFASLWVGGNIRCGGAVIAGNVRLHEVDAGGLVMLDRAQIAGSLSVMPTLDKLLSSDTMSGQPQRGARIARSFSADNVRVGGDAHLIEMHASSISFQGAQLGGSFLGSDLAIDGDLSLKRINVGQNLSLRKVRAAKKVLLDETVVGRDVSFDGCASRLSLPRGRVSGKLHLSGRLAGREPLFLEGAEIGSDVILLGLTLSGDLVNLERMRIGGALNLATLDSQARISLLRSEIKGDLLFEGSKLHQRIDASLIQIEGSVILGAAELSDLSLAGAKITRDLSLVSNLAPPKWTAAALLDLHNAEVGAVADESFSLGDTPQDPWPGRLDLRGFTFLRLVAFGNFGEDLSARTADTLVKWLERDRSGSVQPYTQLAKVLREAGELSKANDVLFAGRELARKQAKSELARKQARSGKALGRWLGLSLLKWTIGYGLGARYFRVLYWIGALWLLGVVTLYLDQFLGGHRLAPGSKTLAWTMAASLDALLPIVSLDPTFSKVVPAHLTSLAAKSVFWFEAVAGWVLGSFLVAGLAGLTQKPS